MKRVKLTVSYDGTAYCGWQKQNNGITVEEVLNRTLSDLLGKEMAVIGASRTDAGVHALGNVAVFDTDARMPAEKFSYALNARLPEDIRIQKAEEVDADFHPRYANSTKTYEYRIYQGPFAQPLMHVNTYFFHRKLDVEKMKTAASYLVGEHDFAAFCSAHAQVRETTRTIYRAEFTETPDENGSGRLLTFRISGNGFLYNMVRIIVGTLLDVGEGRYAPEKVKALLDGGKREDAGPCAPAVGLTLVKIDYEKQLPDELHVWNERMHYSLVQKDIAAKQEAYLTIFDCKEELLEDLIVRMTKKSFRLGAKHLYVRCAGVRNLHEMLGVSRYNKGAKSVHAETAGVQTKKAASFFTAGDYRYVPDHEVRQMDRDLRADPPRTEMVLCAGANAKQPETEAYARTDMPQQAGSSLRPSGKKYRLQPLTKQEVPVFVALYNKCFFSQPCTMTLTEKEALLLAEQNVQFLQEPSETEEGGAVILCGGEKTYLLYQETDAQAEGCLTDAETGKHDGKPVGFLMTTQPLWDEDALGIYAIGVDGPYRRKGLCAQMLEWAAAQAVSEGKKRLTLEVSSRNKKAIACYVQNGFYDIRMKDRWYRADRSR